jgi:rfaE bifunctional protein kinase chain/domain
MQKIGNNRNNVLSDADFNRLADGCTKMPGRKVLVIGDVMVDEYIWGEVRRISPEAPVPVVWVKDETTQLGGAANVVNNLVSLGAQVSCAGVVGCDELGSRVIASINRMNVSAKGIIESDEYQTIRKTRIIAHNQQVVRVDRETIRPIPKSIGTRLLDFCVNEIESVDAVIISDYAKGVVTREIAGEVIACCRQQGKICAVDPKVQSVSYFKNCTVITPNHLEAARMSGIEVDEENATERAGYALIEQLNSEAILITCGELGMALFQAGKPMETIDTVAQSVYDVTGAGDTVISTLSLALAAGMPMKEAAILANFAAGVVVGKVGTATVTIQEIMKVMKTFTSN